jgi:hypothetical protein
MEIKYINYGIGFRYGNTIELNEKLNQEKYKDLKQSIIEHEEKHDGNKLITISDIANDFLFIPKGLFSFIAENPDVLFYMFSPIYRIEGKTIWNPTVTFYWLIGIIIAILGVLILR